jgi:hypothetical protein
MGAQPCPFSHTKSNLAAGEWQSRQGFFNDVLSTLSPRSIIVVPSAETFKAKNSQPLVFGNAARSCFTIASVGINCKIVPVGYSLSGTLSLKIWMASFELLGLGILNPRISYLRQVEQAAKAFFGYHKVISRNGDGQIEKQNQAGGVAHYFSLSWPDTALWEITPALSSAFIGKTFGSLLSHAIAHCMLISAVLQREIATSTTRAGGHLGRAK